MKRRTSLLQSNGFVRLISVVMAVALWVIVSYTGSDSSSSNSLVATTQVLHGVPVQIITSKRYVAVSSHPQTVDVSLAGSILDIASVLAQSAGIRVVADAIHVGPGVHQVPVTVENIPTSAVTGVPVTPYVAVDIQQKVSALLTADVVLTGQPAVSRRAGTPVLSRKSIVVTGPDMQVHKVSRVVATFDVTGLTGTTTRLVHLTAVDAQGTAVKGVVCTPGSVRITMPVFSEVKRVHLSVGTVGSPTAHYIVSGIEILPAQVTVSGPADQLAGMSLISLPPIDVSRWSATRTVLETIPIPFPGGHLNVPVARVRIEVSPSAEDTLQGVPISITGQQSGVQYAFTHQSSVTIVVEGPAAAIAQLSVQDVQAYVDVSNLNAGPIGNEMVGVSLPKNFEVLKVMPQAVRVERITAPHTKP